MKINIEDTIKNPIVKRPLFPKTPFMSLLDSITPQELSTSYSSNKRKTLIHNILDEYNIDYEIQPKIHNIIVKAKIKPKYIVMAHYDIQKNSFGILDNGVAVALLLQFIITYKNQNYTEFVFTDKEEVGMVGAEAYKNYNPFIEEILNVDTIGLGETVFVDTNNKDLKEITSFYSMCKPMEIPPCDHWVFKEKYDVSSLLTGKGDDVWKFLPELINHFHGNYLDNTLENFNEEIIDNTRDIIHDWINAKEQNND